MKLYIKPQLTVVIVDNACDILAGSSHSSPSPQLNDKYISSNKDLSKACYPFDDDEQ